MHSNGASFGLIKYSELLSFFNAQDKTVEEIQKQEQLLSTPSPDSRHWASRSAFGLKSEQAVMKWFASTYPTATVEIANHPLLDFTITTQAHRVGVSVRATSLLSNIRNHIYALAGQYTLTRPSVENFIIVIVLQSEAKYISAQRFLARTAGSIAPTISVLAGYLSPSDEFMSPQKPTL
jgi:hypothetical protein